jgi:tetratricopeptide (TPR) repeat protein
LSPSAVNRIISWSLLLVAWCHSACLPVRAQGNESNSALDTGLERMGHHDFDGAISSFTEVIAFDSKNPKGYVNRGKAFFQLKDYRRAIEDFARANDLSPRDSESFLWKGAAESRLGQDDDAINDYEKAIRFDPQLVINYDKGKSNQDGKAAQSSASTSTHGAQNEHSIQNYEAAMQRVKANP